MNTQRDYFEEHRRGYTVPDVKDKVVYPTAMIQKHGKIHIQRHKRLTDDGGSFLKISLIAG